VDLSDLPDDIPACVKAWIVQLLDPANQAVFRAGATGRLDVHLASSRGRVARQPVITLNGGPQEMISM
jgi:hypothetical protein